MSITKYSDGTFRIPCIYPQQRMSFQTTAYLQNSCECERRVILTASAMAFPPTVCAQWPVGNTPRLTYSHSSGYLHIFAHTSCHRSVVRKKKKKWFLFIFVISRPISKNLSNDKPKRPSFVSRLEKVFHLPLSSLNAKVSTEICSYQSLSSHF